MTDKEQIEILNEKIKRLEAELALQTELKNKYYEKIYPSQHNNLDQFPNYSGDRILIQPSYNWDRITTVT